MESCWGPWVCKMRIVQHPRPHLWQISPVDHRASESFLTQNHQQLMWWPGLKQAGALSKVPFLICHTN